MDSPPSIVGGYQALEAKKQYPEGARREGATGVVWIRCTISATGVPTQINIERSVNFSLESEAVRVVRTLSFEPAIQENMPVPSRVRIPVIFEEPRRPPSPPQQS
jgi:TonB family protein